MKTSFLLLAALLLPAELALSQHAGRALGRRARSFDSRGIRSLVHPVTRHTHKPRHARQSSRYIAQEHETQQPEVQQKMFEDIDEQQPTQQQHEQHDTQQPEVQQQQTMMDDVDLFQKPLEQVTQSPFQYGGYSDNQVPTTIAPLIQQQQISQNDAPTSEEEELAQMRQNSINQDELFAPRSSSSPHYADYSGSSNRKNSPSNYGTNGADQKHGNGNGNSKKNREGIYHPNDYSSNLGTGGSGTGSSSGNEDDVFGNMDGMMGGDPIDMMRAAIKGEPGKDYPILSEIPSDLSFKCSQQQYPGYYADTEARCQVFHICQQDGRHNAFLCPNGTIFSQRHFVCVWWHEFECDQAESLYSLNSELYKNTGNGKGNGYNGGNSLGTGYDGSNTYSGNGEFASNYGENSYGGSGSGDDYKNELFGPGSSSKGTNGDYTPGQQKMNDYSGTKGGSPKPDYSGMKTSHKPDYSGTKTSPKSDYSGMKTAQKPMNDYSGTKTVQQPMNDYSGMKTAQKPMKDYSGMKTSQQPMNDYSGMKTSQQPMNDYSGMKTSQQPMNDYSGMKTSQQPMNDYSGMKTSQQPMNDYSGMKTVQKPMNDYSGTKTSQQPMNDYSGAKTSQQPMNDYSGTRTSQQPMNDYSGMKTAQKPMNDYSGTKTSQQPMNDYSGMKTAQKPMNDYSGMKTVQQPMNDYSGMKTSQKPDYSGTKNNKPDYSGMKASKPDYSGKSGRMSSPKENLNRMYVQQIDDFTTMSPMSYSGNSGKTNSNSPNYFGTKGSPKRPQMFEPQQQQEMMHYDEPQAPVTDSTPMMFTSQQQQQEPNNHVMEDVFEETSTPDSLEAALGEEIHSEAPLIESLALTSSPMRVSTPVPNNYSPYGSSKSSPTMAPSKTASPMKNFYAAQEQQKMSDDAFDKPNYGYSGMKSPKPPKKGSQSSSSMNELKSPMMMMRNYGAGSNKGYSSPSGNSPLKSPSAMMNKSYSPSPSSYGVKQRK